MQVSDKIIWILEDNAASREVFEEILELRFNIRCFENLLSFQTYWLASEELPDLVIVDLRLPDGNFLNFIKTQALENRPFPPFMVISSVDDLDIMRSAFQYGALDYLVKPFKRTEVLVKIERILGYQLSSKMGLFKNISIDPVRMTVKYKRGSEIKLTSKEMQIFNIFYNAKGKSISRTELYDTIWGGQPNSEKTLDVHLSNLRQKIDGLDLQIAYVAPETYTIFDAHIQD